MQRSPIWCLPILLLVFAAHLEAQPPQPDDLSGEDRFVPFYEWWLAERPDESEVVLEAYRATLRAAAWDTTLAVTALQDLETRLEPVSICLNEVQDRFARRLANHDPDALLRLLHLHRQLFVEHVRLQRVWLAEDTRLQLTRWADLYVRKADTPEARARMGRFLLIFADLLRRVQVEGFLEPSLEMLEQAAEYAPKDVGIPHLEAFHWELLDRPKKTLEALDRARSLAPDDPLIRLRTAKARGRLENRSLALTELRVLGEPPNPAWIRRLAIQERFRLLEEMGRSREALAVLEEGVARFPDDPRLELALAAHRRLAGQAPPGATAALLDGFSGEQGPSPRLRYEAGPFETVLLAKQLLDDDVEAHRVRFQEALEHDYRNLWSETRPDSLRRETWYRRCRLSSNPQLPEYLR